MSIKLLTPGEKLRQIRTQYKIRQHEICGDYITRNMISMIETNKAGLTGKTAEILYDNILSLCNEKGLNCEYTLDYLTTPPEAEARKIVQGFINELNSHKNLVLHEDFIYRLTDYNIIMNKYNLSTEKTKLYSNIGNIFLELDNISVAYTYYIRALDICTQWTSLDTLLDLVTNLSHCCVKLENYFELITYWNILEPLLEVPYELHYKLLFNVFTAYNALNDFHNSMETLSKLESLTLKNSTLGFNEEYCNIKITKGMYLLEKNQYVESLNTHRELLNSSDLPSVFKITCLCNMTKIYLNLKDKKNLELYLEKLLNNINSTVIYDRKNLGKHLPNLYSSIAKAFMYLGKYNQCFEYLQRSLNVSKSLNDSDFIVDSITNLFQISISMDNKEIIDEVKTMYIELISRDLIPVNSPIIFSLIKYYNSLKDFDTISQLIEFSTSKNL